MIDQVNFRSMLVMNNINSAEFRNLFFFCCLSAVHAMIQEFPDGVNLLLSKFFLPKTTWKWKKMDRQGALCPSAHSLDKSMMIIHEFN